MKLFLSAHGRMASGMLSSVEILYGKQPDNLVVFDAYVDEKNLRDELEDFFEKCSNDEMKVLMCDIYGGSVCTTMINYINRDNTVLISGITLGILLQLVIAEDEMDKSQIDELIKDAKEYTRIISPEFMETLVLPSDDDFI